MRLLTHNQIICPKAHTYPLKLEATKVEQVWYSVDVSCEVDGCDLCGEECVCAGSYACVCVQFSAVGFK